MKETIKLMNRRAFVNLSAGAFMLSATGVKANGVTIDSDIDASALSASKKTPLGLYLSPSAAHQALTANPEILFVDVRDPIEITFVGHASGLDKIIPLRTATHDVDQNTGQYKMVENKTFIDDFEALLTKKDKTKSDPIFVSCRSGGRSAHAARILINEGYSNVWNLIEGFEGDKAPDGTRTKNGWKNAGLPWSYKLQQGVAWQS